MKFFSLTTLLFIAAAGATGTLLFWASQTVQQKERALASMQQAVTKEHQAIRVLNAEWGYLNRPDRIETLARDYLHMHTPAVTQALPPAAAILPLQKPVQALWQPALPDSPAAYQLPSLSVPHLAVPRPGTKPPHQTRQSFQDLLDDLNTVEQGAP